MNQTNIIFLCIFVISHGEISYLEKFPLFQLLSINLTLIIDSDLQRVCLEWHCRSREKARKSRSSEVKKFQRRKRYL